MTWVRFDDRYRTNRKVAALSDAAYRLDSEAIMWSNSETTNGIVRAHELTQIRAKATRRHVAELVAAGRWHPAGYDCPHAHETPTAKPGDPPPMPTCPGEHGPDGWVIHDYFEFQPTREKVIAEKAAKAERQRNWMAKRRAGTHATGTSAGVSSGASTGPPTDTSTGLVSGAATGRLTGAHPVPVPAPAPAPEGKREGDLPEVPPARRGAAEPADGRRAEDQNLDAANGRIPVRPPDTSALRAQLAAAARKARRPPAPAGAFDELRSATPDVAPLEETWQPPGPGDTPGELDPGEADRPQPIDATENPDAA